ncbi:hypothetical protein CRE_08529 [Caenorhabditis remanei]|uniref:Uncharacterized protein n=1 Tax=Caenorhabditis remanei TaxID=31234 RepID=E3NB86_CAERE|nr:hypothetical protein CRE_08529 [Caenorhabditis remanei]
MVSTRSGNRTTRPSPGEPEKSEAPKPTETPKRRGRSAKNVKKVFDDEESVTTSEATTPMVTPQVSTQISEESVVSGASGADNEPEIVQEEPRVLSPKKSESKVLSPKKNIPSPKKELSEPSIPSIDVFTSDDASDDVKISPKKSESSISLKKEDSEAPEEDSDDDDDEPMEISSKAPQKDSEDVVEKDSEGSDDDDDDEPMEVTSSKVEEKGAEPKSIVEKLLEKKAEKSAKIAAKKLKKRNKKKEMKKISDGVFEVKMKKSKAKFNVVTLSNGVQKMLEPEINFREELLKARTAGTRCVDTEKYYQRAQWVSRR